MKIRLITIFGLYSTMVFSTPQMGDLLILDNDTVDVYSDNGFPLDQYWTDPFDHPSDTLFDRSFAGCGRGYVALWELKNDSLFLLSLLNPIELTELDWNSIFDSVEISSPFFANWFSGSLVIRKGKLLKYEHAGWGGLTEFEVVYELKDGTLKSKTEYVNAIFESEYTNDLQKTSYFLNNNLDKDLVSRNVKDSLKVYIAIYFSESERIADVKIMRCDNEEIRQELIRVVKLIPEWTAHYRRGKLMPYVWTFPFILRNEE